MPAGSPKWRSPSAVNSADIATTEPIDRSISPAVSTKTAPKAMRAIGVTCETIEVAFWRAEKALVVQRDSKETRRRARSRDRP